MTFPIPDTALTQHTAILGKTGSGKTSTGKLVVEHVVELEERVCILDPIKSDWWGLTSSADGKRAGLPFQILGGPHGHVPLHDGAGAAIAELVASGALPLSIIDMADFGPGGQARFFVDFAPVLLRKMRGVLRLVIGEAHLFAPKERSGLGAENMSIHWAKVLATAGRSKGIRLVVETQSVQQLHNRVLGSCENLVAMRLTAPADQKPVIDWLNANAPKDVRDQVRNSLASLKTGTGWLCSGEAGLFERIHFPRIATYDNSATPDASDEKHQVVMAKVDQQQLRALVGDAVKDAEANDPKVLKARIAELERTLRKQPENPKAFDADAIDAAEQRGYTNGYNAGANYAYRRGWDEHRDALENAIESLPKSPPALGDSPRITVHPQGIKRSPATERALEQVAKAVVKSNGADKLRAQSMKILQVLSQHEDGCQAGKLALLTGYAYGGGFRTSLAELRSRGLIEGENTGVMRITDAGLDYGPFEPLPSGDALRAHWLNHPSFRKQAREILAVLLEHPRGMLATDIAQRTGHEYGGGFRTSLSELRTAGLIVGKNTEVMRASEELLA